MLFSNAPLTIPSGCNDDAPLRHVRLFDTILAAFQMTCDAGDAEIAERLLRAAGMCLLRRASPAEQAVDLQSFLDGHYRLGAVETDRGVEDSRILAF